MAKFDTSTIPGYAEMTPEQKVAALEAADLPKPDLSGFVPKATFDKTASEAAEWKRKHNALLSEDEQKKAAAAEHVAELEAKVEELTKTNTINTYKASYLTMGYPEELAVSTAEAMANGDMTKVFANMQEFQTIQKKTLEADLLKGMARPKTGTEPSVNYDAQIKEARERNDLAGVAYWTRVQQQEASAAKK